MFSEGGGAEEDDFGEFGSGNRKLASLFGGLGGGSDGAGSRQNSTDLKYSAPKQPTKAGRGASMAASSGTGGGVMYALPVHAHRYVEGRPINEGPLGAAVVAAPSAFAEEQRRFHLLLYKANKQAVTTATIAANLPSLLAGGISDGAHYVQFNPDSQGNSWSLTVNSAAESSRFCAHVALAQALSASVNPEFTALHVMDTVAGEGAAVGPNDGIEIKYTGWLVHGTTPQLSAKPFDSNVEKDSFYRLKVVSKAPVISGWSQGVVGMRKGSQRVLVIPSSLGYGGKGSGDGRIPPHSTLVFYLSAGRVKIVGGEAAAGYATDVTHSRSSSMNSHVEAPHPYSTDLPTSFSLPLPSNNVPSPSPSPAGAVDSNRRDSTSSIVEEEVGHGRKSLMSRMAKMGQAILPSPSSQPSSSSSEAANETSAETHSATAASSAAHHASTPWMMNGGHHMNGVHASGPTSQTQSSVMIMTPHGLMPAPMQQPVNHGGEPFLASITMNSNRNPSSSQALAPYVGGSAAQQMMLAPQGMLNNTVVPQQFAAQHQPQQLQQQQPVAATSSLDSQLAPILVSENRQQNTEVRMSIDKVLTKMDEMRVVITSLEQKVTASSTISDALVPAMEVSVLQANLSRIINENTSMKETLVAKSCKIEEMNKRIGEILTENQAFVEQSHKQLIARNSSLVTSSASTESRVLELENERLELTRQLGDRVAELANSQRLLREAEVKEKDLSDKLDQLQASMMTNEKTAREDALTARESKAEVEKLQSLLRAAEKEEKMAEEKTKATVEELAEARKEAERIRRGVEEAKTKWGKEREDLERELEASKEEKEAEIEEWKSKMKKKRSSTDAQARSTVADLEKQLQEEFAEKTKRQTKLIKEKMAAAMAEMEEEKTARDDVIEAAKRKIGTLKEALSSARRTNHTLTDESAQMEEEKNALQEKYKKLYKNAGLLKAKYEERLEEAENDKSGLEGQMDKLETQLEESRSAAISAERRLKLNAGSDRNADSSAKVKKILSSTYHEIKRKIDPGRQYMGENLHKIILDTIRKITLDAATSEENGAASQAKSVEGEPEVSIAAPLASVPVEAVKSPQLTDDGAKDEMSVSNAHSNIGMAKAAAYVQSLATEDVPSHSARGSFSSEGSSSFETAVFEKDAVSDADLEHSSVSVYGDFEEAEKREEVEDEEPISVDVISSPALDEQIPVSVESNVSVRPATREEEGECQDSSLEAVSDKSKEVVDAVTAEDSCSSPILDPEASNKVEVLKDELSVEEPQSEDPAHSFEDEADSSRNATPTPDSDLVEDPDSESLGGPVLKPELDGREETKEASAPVIEASAASVTEDSSASVTEVSSASGIEVSSAPVTEVSPASVIEVPEAETKADLTRELDLLSLLAEDDRPVVEMIAVEEDPLCGSSEPSEPGNQNDIDVELVIEGPTGPRSAVDTVVEAKLAEAFDPKPDQVPDAGGFGRDFDLPPKPPIPPPLSNLYPNEEIIEKKIPSISNSFQPKSSSLFGFDDDDDKDDDAALFFRGSKTPSESKSRTSSKASAYSEEPPSKESRTESIFVKDTSPSNVGKPQPPPLIFDDDDEDDDLDWLQ